MDNPWKSLKPGILKAISKEVQAHKFYWYVEENNLNPCLRFRIRKETKKNNNYFFNLFLSFQETYDM